MPRAAYIPGFGVLADEMEAVSLEPGPLGLEVDAPTGYVQQVWTSKWAEDGQEVTGNMEKPTKIDANVAFSCIFRGQLGSSAANSIVFLDWRSSKVAWGRRLACKLAGSSKVSPVTWRENGGPTWANTNKAASSRF